MTHLTQSFGWWYLLHVSTLLSRCSWRRWGCRWLPPPEEGWVPPSGAVEIWKNMQVNTRMFLLFPLCFTTECIHYLSSFHFDHSVKSNLFLHVVFMQVNAKDNTSSIYLLGGSEWLMDCDSDTLIIIWICSDIIYKSLDFNVGAWMYLKKVGCLPIWLGKLKNILFIIRAHSHTVFSPMVASNSGQSSTLTPEYHKYFKEEWLAIRYQSEGINIINILTSHVLILVSHNHTTRPHFSIQNSSPHTSTHTHSLTHTHYSYTC